MHEPRPHSCADAQHEHDDVLAERWRRGERDAGRRLVARYFDTVAEAFAEHGLGASARARAVFERVQRSLDQLERDPSFANLVLTHTRALACLELAARVQARSGPLSETLDLDSALH